MTIRAECRTDFRKNIFIIFNEKDRKTEETMKKIEKKTEETMKKVEKQNKH